jgi:hypothetical protein
MAVAKDESECVRQIRKLFRLDLADVSRKRDAVLDVHTPEPAVETRDAVRIMELDEMRWNIPRGFQSEHCPGRSGGRNWDRFAPWKSMEFIQVFDAKAPPCLWMHGEDHAVRMRKQADGRRAQG